MEKELLLRDLSARLPYGVKATYYGGGEERETLDEIEGITIDGYVDIGAYSLPIERITPYLFPLSSITEEQKKELFHFCDFYVHEDWEGKKTEVYGIEIASRPDPAHCYDNTFRMWGIDMIAINWLLKNHFDINGLIPMGLASNATGLNIY